MVNLAPEVASSQPDIKDRRRQLLSKGGNVEVSGQMPALPDTFSRLINSYRLPGNGMVGYRLWNDFAGPGAKEVWTTMSALNLAEKPRRRRERRRIDDFTAHLKTVVEMQAEGPRKFGWPREEETESVEERLNRERETVAGLQANVNFREGETDPVRRLYWKLGGLVEGTLGANEKNILEFFYWLNEAREGKGDRALATIEQARTKRPSLI